MIISKVFPQYITEIKLYLLPFISWGLSRVIISSIFSVLYSTVFQYGHLKVFFIHFKLCLHAKLFCLYTKALHSAIVIKKQVKNRAYWKTSLWILSRTESKLQIFVFTKHSSQWSRDFSVFLTVLTLICRVIRTCSGMLIYWPTSADTCLLLWVLSLMATYTSNWHITKENKRLFWNAVIYNKYKPVIKLNKVRQIWSYVSLVKGKGEWWNKERREKIHKVLHVDAFHASRTQLY